MNKGNHDNNKTSIGEIKEIVSNREFSKLFKGATNNTYIQFFRYLFVGGMAAVVDFAASSLVFFFLFGERLGAVFAPVPWFTWAVLSNGAGFVLGLIFNYILSTCFVFQNSNVKNKLLEFLSFAAIGLVGLFITFGVTWVIELLLGDKTSLFQLIGKIAATAVSFLWNFFARKILLYRQK
ncbi:MAG: GtrA family protein [Ruminococcus sp.]